MTKINDSADNRDNIAAEETSGEKAPENKPRRGRPRKNAVKTNAPDKTPKSSGEQEQSSIRGSTRRRRSPNRSAENQHSA